MQEIIGKPLENIQLAVLLNSRINVYKEDPNKTIKRSLHHYKSAANYAAKIITDPKRYYFTFGGDPAWKEGLSIFDEHHVMVANGKGYDTIITGTTIYPPVMYVLTAINNARRDVRDLGNEWLTMAEAETEYGLKPGTIRQYVNNHRQEMRERKYIKQADGRTVLIKRGIVINRWMQKR